MKTLMHLTMAIFAAITVTAHAATAKNAEIVKLAGPNHGIAVVHPDTPATIAPADWNADTNIGLTSTALGENTDHAFTAIPGTNAVTNGIGITTQSKAGYGEITGAFTNNGHTVANTATERTAMD